MLIIDNKKIKQDNKNKTYLNVKTVLIKINLTILKLKQ